MAAVVYGTYGRFIPFYIYSVLKSYPDYFVKIYVQGQLSSSERRAIDLLRNNDLFSFQIIEDYHPKILGNTLRWLLPESDFEGFDYLYVGDVDFLIVRESPTLADGHIRHCQQRNLPWSNELRIASNRLTGLHFVIIEEYYRALGDKIDELRSNIGAIYEFAPYYPKHDEVFLRDLVQQAFPVVESTPEDFYRPHHGFHLGHTRSRDTQQLEWYITDVLLGAAVKVDLRDMSEQIVGYFADPTFQKLLVAVPEPGVLMLPKALGFPTHSRRILLARTKLFLIEIPDLISQGKRKLALAVRLNAERFKRLVVRILRTLKLKPPAPDSEREK